MTQGDLFQKENSLVISGDQGEAEYVPNFFFNVGFTLS